MHAGLPPRQQKRAVSFDDCCRHNDWIHQPPATEP
jgi:hypothetical protein